MESFKEYLINEFKDRVKGFVGVEFKFSHGVNMRTDNVTKIPLKVDVVKVSLRFVDKDLNTLLSSNVVFENNAIQKSKEKQFINISPKELNNKFCFAKSEIIRTIMNEYINKRDELNEKIDSLKSYAGNDNEVIDSRFKGDVVNVVEKEVKPSKKVRFEM